MTTSRRLPAWLDTAAYPFPPQWYETSWGAMHYLDVGEGSPVVLVHGNPTWSFQFRTVVPMLSGHRAIAPDHLGFGLSAKPTGFTYLPRGHAANLAALLDSLDLHDVTLVVGDWGGPLALSWALDNPDRVRALVITNSWMWSVRGDWYYEAFSRFMGGPVGRRLILHRNFFAGSFLPRAYGDRSRLTPEIHRQYTSPLATPGERLGSAVFPREILGSSDWLASLWDRRARLAGMDVAIAWGMKDIAFREKELRRWRELFPRAAVTRLPDCGHYVAEEAPLALADAILAVAG